MLDVMVKGVAVADAFECEPRSERDELQRFAEPVFDNDLQDKLQSSGPIDETTEEEEELVQKCIDIMRQERKASTSLFQRRLRLGYSRAARIVVSTMARCTAAGSRDGVT